MRSLWQLACLLGVTWQAVLVVMVQEGQLLSFGRATYGRIGRLDVDPKGDDSNPQARPVDNLEGATVKGMAAGEVPPPSCIDASPTLSASVCLWMQPPRHTCWCLPDSCSFALIGIMCFSTLAWLLR